MSSTPSEEPPLTVTLQATPATPSPSLKAFDFDFSGTNYEMDASVSEEERRFYLKMYPSVDVVIQRKVHCTVCRTHIGSAPSTESNIKMHPILRVTHCVKCHDFYNSGEFSKGEDGSELYCRWCGQGGEVYCCSTCPFVFCKSCIIKNLSRGVIVDIEQNENWNCFRCTSKILWPLRAQHWALINFIETQKKGLQAMQLSETELRRQLQKDYSTCCRLAKSKANSTSDSMESLESNASKRSHVSSVPSVKRSGKPLMQATSKRAKLSNDEVVCTPDLLSMLEPDCQISVSQKPTPRTQVPSSNNTTTPRIVTVQQNYTGPSSSPSPSSNGNLPASTLNSLPPPLVLSSSGMRYRQTPPNNPIVRRTVVPNAIRSAGPVFHTINGFRVDLNSAAQQESYRLPNGRLIQVKRQVPANTQPPTTVTRSPVVLNPQVIIRQHTSPASVPRIAHNSPGFGTNMGIFNPQTNQQQRAPNVVRVNNGSQIHSMNISPAPASTTSTPVGSNGGTTIMMTPQTVAKGPTLVRHIFPQHGVGRARAQLQDQIFNAMEICTHLTGKVQTLTHSNAYNQARSYTDLKELYIHLSYLTTYAIGRFKQLQDKCLVDMREMGFKNDANSLENGQLAAAVDYVCYGQLDDVDLGNTGCNSFHNQVYEYRKSLQANLKDGQCIEPLPPLMPLGVRAEGDPKDEDDEQENNDENDNDEHDVLDDEQINDIDDADDGEDIEDLDDDYDALGTEESMNRNEQAHAYDRKLTRLLREYPSIWCTRHPDYGNMDVTRKQWRVIASHFPRGDDIKLRWKNVRKRYVRIERLLKQGKRFKGYFDKATNYLANRDLPRSEWKPVDCGEADGDSFERKQLDAIENTIHKDQNDLGDKRQQQLASRLPVHPLEVRPIDMRIINFAKSHPVLWRKSADPEFNSIDEQTRKSLWINFGKSAPNYRCEYIEERWQQMYEMYKSFRLKTIKNKQTFANLELKYSKYLANLYFLYKIDEQDLRDEFEPLQDCVENEANSSGVSSESAVKLKDMPDDKQFVQQLVSAMRAYPTLWNPRHVDYNDVGARERLWAELARRLPRFRRDARACKLRWQMAKFAYECYTHAMDQQPRPNDKTLQKLQKQASDDEDNEIEIVEPKTDTITIDSDNEEDSAMGPKVSEPVGLKITSVLSTAQKVPPKAAAKPAPMQPATQPPTPALISAPDLAKVDPITANMDPNSDVDVQSFCSSILASLLEVDITEGPGIILPKKQPRKKTTNKPNPALLHLERQRIQETKRNDAKLQMKLVVKLRRAEKDFEVARKWVEENKLKRESKSVSRDIDEKQASDSEQKEMLDAKLNKSDTTNEDESEEKDAENQKLPWDDKSLDITDKSTADKSTSISSIQENVEIPDDVSKETIASKDSTGKKPADEELSPTEALLGKDSELEAMEVMEMLETLGKMDVPELVKSLDAATNIEAEFIGETKTSEAANNKEEDTVTDIADNKDATNVDEDNLDTLDTNKTTTDENSEDNLITSECQNPQETEDGNNTSMIEDSETEKTMDIEKNIPDSPTDNDLDLQEAMEVMQSIDGDVGMEVTDIIASLTSDMFADVSATEMEAVADIQEASDVGDVSPSQIVDECYKDIDYSTKIVPAEQAANDEVVAAAETPRASKLAEPAVINTPSSFSQSKSILSCKQNKTQIIEMENEDSSDQTTFPGSETEH